METYNCVSYRILLEEMKRRSINPYDFEEWCYMQDLLISLMALTEKVESDYFYQGGFNA